jgi:hypothetical protein
MAKKLKMLSFVQICGVQSFRVAANGKVYAFGCDYKHGLIKLKQNLIEWIKL